MRIFHEEKPENIKWKEIPADYVIESTGRFTEVEPATVTLTLFCIIQIRIIHLHPVPVLVNLTLNSYIWFLIF